MIAAPAGRPSRPSGERPMGKKKKIAVVIPRYGLVGGAENFASELTTRIAADPRYDVHVFANRWREEAPGITFHRVPIVRFPRSLTTPSFAWFANRAIAQGDFDLVHTHDRIFEADLFTMHGIPHRLWVRDVRKKRMSLFDRSTRWVEEKLVSNPRCRRFLAVSTITKEKFIAEFGIGGDRVLVVPPGTDVERFAHRNREVCRDELRRSLGLDPATQILLFVSMNFEVKGLDYVMRGLAQLKRETGQPVPLLFIVGRGNEGNTGGWPKSSTSAQTFAFRGSRDGRTSTPSTWEAISSPCSRASTPSAWRPSMPWPHRFRSC